MTQTEIFDWLSTQGVKDPAVLMLGTRCIVGRWESVSSQLPNGYVCRSGNVAIVVLGEASNWIEAQAAAALRLKRHSANGHAEVAKPLS